MRFKKYYKALFLGLVDMAIVNAFIIHKLTALKKGDKPMSHVKFLKELHLQLIQVTESDLQAGAAGRSTPSSTPATPTRTTTGHDSTLTDEWHVVSNQKKRRQRACKICSLLTLQAPLSRQIVDKIYGISTAT